MFGALLHMPLTADEYSRLTLYELEEFRAVCKEISKGR